MLVKEFLIIRSTKTEKNKFFVKNKSIKEITKNINFILGYKIYNNKNSGEYLEISLRNQKITIKNDNFGTYPVYIFKSTNKIIISSCLSWLINESKETIFINKNSLYTYFAWGYIPASNESIYEKIKTLEPNNSIILGKKIKITKTNPKIFYSIKKKYNIVEFSDLVKNKIDQIFEKFEVKKSYIGLTAGYDSLLGSYLIKKIKKTFTTATYGEKDSEEVKRATYRSAKYLNSEHFNVFANTIIPTNSEVIKLSKMTGGLNTIASFPQYNFHKKMLSKKKKIFFDFSMFEFFRKKPLKKIEMLNKYTTPKNVVATYFKDKKHYKNQVKLSFQKICKKYNKNFFQYFYILDRASKNQLNKAIFLKNLGMTKVAVAHDRDILNYNFNYILKKNKLPYIELLKNSSTSLNNYKNENIYLKNIKDKHLAYDYKKLCYRYKSLFNSVLEKEEISKFNKYFDNDLIKKNINSENLGEKHEWFILRIMNFYIFASMHKIKLNKK